MPDGTPGVAEHHRQQPTLHSPYEEPDRHWKRTPDEKDTVKEIMPESLPVRGTRPPPQASKEPVQPTLADAQKSDQLDHELLERLRRLVGNWRKAGWRGTTSATRQLLEYWSRPQGEGATDSPFWAQRESVETIVYLTEVAAHDSSELREYARRWSRDLMRVAISMATGTGNPGREHRATTSGLARNVGRIVVIAPSRTIARQLQMLVPANENNIYTAERLTPHHLLKRLNGMRVHVLNYKKLQPRAGAALADIEGASKNARVLAEAEEQIDSKSRLQSLMKRNGIQGDFFSNFNEYGSEDRATLEWYEHAANWSNRLIHSDARRAMASLVEHEHTGGAVQMNYFDPPYGMDFDAKYSNDTTARRAFAETYRWGIHSYLDTIRETMKLARELLTESGSFSCKSATSTCTDARSSATRCSEPRLVSDGTELWTMLRLPLRTRTRMTPRMTPLRRKVLEDILGANGERDVTIATDQFVGVRSDDAEQRQ